MITVEVERLDRPVKNELGLGNVFESVELFAHKATFCVQFFCPFRTDIEL
jgi:hypothetical protein